jgi:hypothetical protein
MPVFETYASRAAAAAKVGAPDVNRLFHYQRFDADWLKLAIFDETVRFSNPANFNDPWDCRPFFYIPSENEPDLRERYVQWFDSRSRKYNHDLSEEQHGLNTIGLRRDRSYFETIIGQFSESMMGAIHKQYRIYCLSTQPDSPLMWSHYADNHQGICLEFSCDNEVFGTAIKINYADDYPRFDLTDDGGDILSPLITKSRVWSYEDEYRVIALEKFIGPPVAGVLRTKNNFLKLPHGALKAVIIGCMILQSEVEKLREIIGQRFSPNVVLKRAARVPNRYDLSIETC